MRRWSRLRDLPEEDLFFLDRDITDELGVDGSIKASGGTDLVTIVPRQDNAIMGDAAFHRGRVRWTRHVVERRLLMAESVSVRKRGAPVTPILAVTQH